MTSKATDEFWSLFYSLPLEKRTEMVTSVDEHGNTTATVTSWPPHKDTFITDPAREELKDRKGRPVSASGDAYKEHMYRAAGNYDAVQALQDARRSQADADCVQVAPGVWCVGGKVGIARQSVTLAEAQSGVERYSVYMNTTDMDVAKRLARALAKSLHPQTG